MPTLWLKLGLTPLLMVGATMAVRRWGPVVGGWIIGLPLTSGPISLLLYLERGPVFAAHAAVSTLLGINGVTACVVTYAHGARRWGWPATGAASLVAFLLMMALLDQLHASPVQAFAGSAIFAVVGLYVLPSGGAVPIAPPPRWDLVARIGLAMGMVLLITSSAGRLGPTLSGLLSPFPVFTLVMAVFSHHQTGGSVAAPYARGLITSSIGFAAFFLVVALRLERAGVMAFGLATLAALGVGAAAAAAAARFRRV